MLKYNGLYVCEEENQSSRYLRFYEDGTVLSVSSSGNPNQVILWFNKLHPNTSKGSYHFLSPNLKFSATSECGTVNYSGKADGEMLALEIQSLINGYNATKKYFFVPLSENTDDGNKELKFEKENNLKVKIDKPSRF